MDRHSGSDTGSAGVAKDPVERPYFFWDYDLTEADVRRIVREGTPQEQAWVVARILEYAKWDDIWRFLTPDDIRRNLDRLRFRLPQDRQLWEYALTRWAERD
jgi:hypothetical protein